jgi:hypothetical protein
MGHCTPVQKKIKKIKKQFPWDVFETDTAPTIVKIWPLQLLLNMYFQGQFA